jgi:hypothetical protein
MNRWKYLVWTCLVVFMGTLAASPAQAFHGRHHHRGCARGPVGCGNAFHPAYVNYRGYSGGYGYSSGPQLYRPAYPYQSGTYGYGAAPGYGPAYGLRGIPPVFVYGW